MKKLENNNFIKPNRNSVTFLQPTNTTEAFANIFQNEDGKSNRRLNIQQIKQQIQAIKRKNSNRKKFIKEPQQSLDGEQIFLKYSNQKNPDFENFEEIKIVQFQETDKYAPIFSPYRDKSENKKQFIAVDTSINWKKPIYRYQQSKQQRQKSITLSTKKTPMDLRRETISYSRRISADSAFHQNNISNFKIKKINISKQNIKEDNQQKILNLNLLKMEDLYQKIADIMGCLKKQRTILVQKVKVYVQSISSQNFDFLDKLIQQVDKKYHKFLHYSRIMQNISIIYLILELLKQAMDQHLVNISNLIGHTASNIILLYKLYIIVKKVKTNSLTSKFQASMKQFQKQSFRQQLINVDQIMVRVQHNNQITLILQNKVGRSNPKFSIVLKKFVKNFERENYTPSQAAHYLFQYLAYYIYENQLNGRITFLDIAPNPYLPPITENKYTIIIEPYGVLFYLKNDRFILRSFTKQFLQYISKYFQVVFWTWLMPIEFEPYLQRIDPNRKINHKLYRYHCKYVCKLLLIKQQSIYIKNVSRTGRDLQKTLIIDYDPKIYALSPNNGIEIGWNGLQNDNKLVDLTQILVEVLKNNITIPNCLKIYNEEINNLKRQKLIKLSSRK